MTNFEAFPRGSVAVRKTRRAALFCSGVWLAVMSCASITSAAPGTVRADKVRFELVHGNGAADQIKVTGLPADEVNRFKELKTRQERQAVLSVAVVRADSKANATSMLGSYQVKDGAVIFKPRFPFREGVSFQATWKSPDSISASGMFKIEVKDHTPPQVTQIYPTANVLPENQLKFYIHFSKAMQQGEAYQHIRLIEKSSGKEVETPFLELGEELWDPDGKRFTLYFDPGRIKRGLQPRKLFGPTLEAGKEYTLIISDQWKDASAGKGLERAFRKSFKAAEPDTTTPDHKRWKIRTPKSGTRDALQVEFDEPLDHAMLLRVIHPESPDGKPIPGEPSVRAGETQWLFVPDQPWAAGISTLKIATELEDRAGNSIGRPFEVDMIEKNTERVPQKTATLRFRVK